MGQYYKPISLNKEGQLVNEWVLSHDYNNGLKLMEHSWLGNDFVSVVETLLIPGGKWYKKGIVWAGDYADEETDSKTNLYSRCKDENKINPIGIVDDEKYCYIVNHTKQQFVDKRKVPVSGTDGWQIHPLPLLTCEGNGRGGGDYHGENDIIGSWSRNSISIECTIPEGYTELEFILTED